MPSATPWRMASQAFAGESDTPLFCPVACFVCTKTAWGNSARFSSMNTSSPLPTSTGTPYSPASAP